MTNMKLNAAKADGSPAHLRPSRHHGTPQPLSAGSRYLAYARTEAAILAPKPGKPGVWTEVATGRFETTFDAKKWADLVHPDAVLVNLTRFQAATGWVPQAIGERRNGAWS